MHEPQPEPARVTLTTSWVEPSCASRMALTISPLQTPLQLHTCAVSGSSAAVAWLASASSSSASPVARPVRTASVSSSAPRASPSRIAPRTVPSAAVTSLRYVPAAALLTTTSCSPATVPAVTRSIPMTLSLAVGIEPA